MTRPASSRRKAALTLVELLVVIAIIGILASIVIVVAIRSRAKARAIFCLNQIRQVGLALGAGAGDADVSTHWTEHFGRGDQRDDVLLCPDGPQDGETNYAVNSRLLGFRVLDCDTSRTVLAYESRRAGSSLVGTESDVDPRHEGGSNYVFLDGHAKWSRQPPSFAPR
jgi:prepilin-type N-terminal cleavage/methylation domain-containing protein/prepilin-type processing-associated H-X9-DG protein